jgi:hypothetical protein
MSFAQKNRLPMKKSSVRFFHGEPIFSGKQPHSQKMHKYTDKNVSLCIHLLTLTSFRILVQLVQLVQVPFPNARAK